MTISYAPLWQTMKNKGISTYALINEHGVASKTVYNLKHNRSITMYTLGNPCRILQCTPNDVVTFIEEKHQ